MLRTLSIIFLVFVLNIGISQDIHYTNFGLAPHSLNPATVGDFRGSFRIGAAFRDQFSKFFDQGYKTQGFFVEHNLPLGLKPWHWVGIGAAITNDVAGGLGFGSNRIDLTGAYHFALDEGYNTVISVAGQFSYISRNADQTAALRIHEELVGSVAVGGSIDNQLFQNYNGSTMDGSLGFHLKSILSKKTVLSIGTGVYHLVASRRHTSVQLIDDFIPLRVNAHAELRMLLDKVSAITPRLYYGRTDNSNFLSAQLVYHRLFGKSELQLGLGSRLGDSANLLAGIVRGPWKVLGSFDFTVSSASTYNNNNGGFELGLQRIITKHPQAKVKFIELCPRL